MTDAGASPNDHEPDKAGTEARDRVEAVIEDLRQRGGIFVEAVRATRMPMALTDPNLPGNPIVFANQSFLNLSGYRMDEVLGQQPYFMNGPDTDPQDAHRFRDILERDQDGVVETVQYAKDGRRFVATVLLSAFKDEDGNTLHHFLSWADVTRRVDAEEEASDLRRAQAVLRESEARLRLLQTSWETDAEGVVVSDSPSWRANTGQTLDEWLGYGWLDAVHPDDRAYAEKQWREAVDARGMVDAEFRLRSPDGGWRWTNVRAAPVLDAEGRIEKWAGMNIDIDARKRAESVLQESQQRQAFLLKLSDELRVTPDDAIIDRAVEMLVDELRLDLCYVANVFTKEDRADVIHQLRRHNSMRDIPATIRLSDYPKAFLEWQERTLVSEDMANDPALTDLDRQNVAAMHFGALIAAPVRRGSGNPIWTIVAVMAEPRRWTPGDVVLVEETAELTWAAVERSRAENALRESEQRYRSLFQNMGQGYARLELIRDAEGRAFDKFYLELNPALGKLTGLDVTTMTGRRGSEFFGDTSLHWAEIFDPIARSGSPARIEDKVGDRWFDVLAYPQGGDHLTVFFEDITERKHAETVRREQEARQAFLLKLSDAIRTIADPVEIQSVALRLLAKHMDLSRAAYSEILPDQDRARRVATFDGDLPPVPTDVRISDFSAAQLDCYLQGRPFVVADTETDDRVAATREACRAIQVRAWIGVPIVKRGELLSVLGVEKMKPYAWTDAEVELVQEVTERTWAAAERGRIETTLRDSEERFRQFGDNSSDAIWIVDTRAMQLEYLSPAFERIWGERRDAIMSNIARWSELVHPDDLPEARQAMDQLLAGRSFVAEYRIVRPDGGIRWIRDAGFPILTGSEVTRGGGIAQDITDLRLAEDRQRLLMAELQHRVRNIMAMLRSIVRRTSATKTDVEDFVQHLQGRIDAMARTQALLTSGVGRSIDLELVIREELLAQVAEDDRYRLCGPTVLLSAHAAEVLTLVLHELATNSVKYGALGSSQGMISIQWEQERREGSDHLRLIWAETGLRIDEPDPPAGFGTELITRRVPYELGGTSEMSLTRSGLTATIMIPLREGMSVLQTDAAVQEVKG